jgi:hypothetical protein
MTNMTPAGIYVLCIFIFIAGICIFTYKKALKTIWNKEQNEYTGTR